MTWEEFRRRIAHLPPGEIERIHEAYDLGWQAHGNQKRKSGEPYFHHPIAVAAMLADIGADADTVAAALLHDTVEDTDLTSAEIDHKFNGTVSELVEGVTKLSRADVGEKPTMDEQIETLRKMFTVMQRDVRIMVIKLIDRLHNMQTVRFLPPERQRSLAKETADVYVKIADRLCMQDLRDELQALCLQVQEPEKFTALSQLLAKNSKQEQDVLHSMGERLRTHPSVGASVVMLGEPKSWDALEKQLRAGGAAAVGVSDITVVFVCPDRDNCYRVMGALHEVWKRETMSFEDFINAPAVNGYRGLHTTVILEGGKRVRCKIRTKEMHEYARRGIATLCFRTPGKGLSDALEWTEHISSLDEDTRGRSSAFWEGLRSDILGQAMVVHGPADEAVNLPSGSTALDGAFYLFKEVALRLKSLKVNGQEVSFSHHLKPGDALTATFFSERTVRREWLNAVRTGLATAIIRSSLSSMQSPEEKLLLGRAILEKAMEQHGRGYIEEFRQENITEALEKLGFDSLSEAYIALADGRADARDVEAALFERESKRRDPLQRRIIHYTVETDDAGIMSRIADVHRAFRDSITEVRYRRAGMGMVNATMDKQTLRTFTMQLGRAGAQNIETSLLTLRMGIVTASCLLVLLWGLDPVFARYVLTSHDVMPLDLTIIRFVTLSVMTGLLYWQKRSQSVLPPAPLPLWNPSLWMSTALFFAIALSTYASLKVTMPLQYTIPMTSAGMLITSIVERHNKLKILLVWLLCLSGYAVLALYTPGWSNSGMLVTLLAVVSFTAYWLISERYKRQERVSYRSVQFFFVICVLCGLLGLMLLPFSSLALYDPSTLIAMIVFSVVFVGLPYHILYTSQHYALWISSRFSFVTILFTGIAQLLLFKSIDTSAIIAGCLVVLGAMVLSAERLRRIDGNVLAQ